MTPYHAGVIMEDSRAFEAQAPAWPKSLQPQERMILAILAVFTGFPAAVFAVTPLSHDWTSLGPVWLALAMLLGASCLIHTRLSRPIGVAMMSWTVFFAISLLGSLNGALLAASALPIVDPLLASADAFIGFDWLALFSAWQDHEEILAVLSFAYSTLSWQPVLLLGLLALRGEDAVAQRFLIAWAVSLMATLLIFPLAPAYGNFITQGISLTEHPAIMVHSAWSFADTFDQLRTGVATTITRAMLDGLVTFPSFHTSGAVILAAYWSAIPRLRVPFCALNAMMIVSAVLIGGHYLVDILAGIANALAAVQFASRSTRPVRASRRPALRSARARVPAALPTSEAGAR